jgi:hypothetical protein
VARREQETSLFSRSGAKNGAELKRSGPPLNGCCLKDAKVV